MLRPVHFELYAEDLQRAKKFYETVFGWQFSKWEGYDYWMIKTGSDSEKGIDGGMLPRKGTVGENDPVIGYVNTIDVPNLDEYSEKVKAAGGINVVPKRAIPKMAYLAYFKDTEGNIFGMFESNPEAK